MNREQKKEARVGCEKMKEDKNDKALVGTKRP